MLIQAYLGAAESFLTLGVLNKAESIARQAIQINARFAGANEILGNILQKKKNYKQAAESYQKELNINPQASTSLLNYGLMLLRLGKISESIEPLTLAAAINPSEQCSLLLAQAYQNTGQLNEAIVEYKKLDVSRIDNKLIPFNLGICLLKTSNNADAMEAFRSTINLDKTFVPAWENLVIALTNQGKHQEALPILQKVIELVPNNPTAYMNLGGIHKEIGNLDQALAATLKSLELDPDNPIAYMNLGGIHKEIGNLDQALAATLKSLELEPDNPIAYMNLGSSTKRSATLMKLLPLSTPRAEPDNPIAYMNLGVIYKEIGNLDEALVSTNSPSSNLKTQMLPQLGLDLQRYR